MPLAMGESDEGFIANLNAGEQNRGADTDIILTRLVVGICVSSVERESSTTSKIGQ